MEKSSKPARPNYQEVLRKRAEQLLQAFDRAEDRQAELTAIYEALRAVALESWKNGLDAGARRKRPNQPARA